MAKGYVVDTVTNSAVITFTANQLKAIAKASRDALDRIEYIENIPMDSIVDLGNATYRLEQAVKEFEGVKSNGFSL